MTLKLLLQTNCWSLLAQCAKSSSTERRKKTGVKRTIWSDWVYFHCPVYFQMFADLRNHSKTSSLLSFQCNPSNNEDKEVDKEVIGERLGASPLINVHRKRFHLKDTSLENRWKLLSRKRTRRISQWNSSWKWVIYQRNRRTPKNVPGILQRNRSERRIQLSVDNKISQKRSLGYDSTVF